MTNTITAPEFQPRDNPFLNAVFDVSALTAIQPDLVFEGFSSFENWNRYSQENRWLFDQQRTESVWHEASNNGINSLWLGHTPAADVALGREGIRVGRLLPRLRVLLDLVLVTKQAINHARQVRIYAAEARSAFALQLRSRYPRFIGSEYIPQTPDLLFPIEHQDLTKLTYPAAVFDIAITSDVLEHVSDLGAALTELARILKPGGIMLCTIPFRYRSPDTLIKARMVSGVVEHLVDTPEYHSDPNRPDEGALVFQLPGWDILDLCRKTGFSAAEFCIYSSGSGAITGIHLGGLWVLVAQK